MLRVGQAQRQVVLAESGGLRPGGLQAGQPFLAHEIAEVRNLGFVVVVHQRPGAVQRTSAQGERAGGVAGAGLLQRPQQHIKLFVVDLRFPERHGLRQGQQRVYEVVDVQGMTAGHLLYSLPTLEVARDGRGRSRQLQQLGHQRLGGLAGEEGLKCGVAGGVVGFR